MIYVVDPSLELPVEKHETVAAAYRSMKEWLDRGKLPRLYAFNTYSRRFREWIASSWYDAEKENLPAKVLAVDRT